MNQAMYLWTTNSAALNITKKQQTLQSQMIWWVPLLFCPHHFHSCYQRCHGCHAHLMAWSPSSVLPVIRTWDPTAANLRTAVMVMTLMIVMMILMVMMIAILMMVMLIAIVMAMIKKIETLAWRKSTAWFVPWTCKAMIYGGLFLDVFRKWGGGSKAVWNYSENSSDLVASTNRHIALLQLECQ